MIHNNWDLRKDSESTIEIPNIILILNHQNYLYYLGKHNKIFKTIDLLFNLHNLPSLKTLVS